MDLSNQSRSEDWEEIKNVGMFSMRIQNPPEKLWLILMEPESGENLFKLTFIRANNKDSFYQKEKFSMNKSKASETLLK